MKTATFLASLFALAVFSTAQACPYKDKVTSIKLYQDKVTEAQSPAQPSAEQQELIVDLSKQPKSTAN